VRFVLGHPLLRPLLIGATVGALCSNTIGSILILYAVRDLGLPAWAYGVVIGTGGPAALLGALVASRVLHRCGLGKTLIGAALASSAATLLIVLAGDQFLAALALLIAWRILASLAEAIGGIATFTLLQTLPPPELQGRVNATVRVFGWGAVALGGLLGGVSGEALGLRPTIALAACGMLLAPLWLLRSRVHTLQDLATATTNTSPPATA